jgi:hypothetical protein
MNHKWQDVEEVNSTYSGPTIINGQVLRRDKRRYTMLGEAANQVNNRNPVNMNSNKSIKELEQKVAIIGDSHLWGSAESTGDPLSAKFEVTVLLNQVQVFVKLWINQ